jgi:hypothetical protein
MPDNPVPHGNFLQEVGYRFRLIFTLLGDKRTGILPRLVMLFAFGYVVNPFDLPSLLDDAVVLILMSVLFVELAPPEIVKEHLDRMRSTIPGKWRDVTSSDGVIDGHFIDPKEKQEKDKD